MKLTGCPHEPEVRALIARGEWPQSAVPELRDHVAGCRACSDLALVSEVFLRARTVTLAAARPEPAGVLWWRAQLRRRHTVMEQLTRPLLGAQIFALAVTLLASLGFAGFEAHHDVAWLTWVGELPQSVAAHWDEVQAAGIFHQEWTWLVLVPALATFVLLGGVAIYLATEKQ